VTKTCLAIATIALVAAGACAAGYFIPNQATQTLNNTVHELLSTKTTTATTTASPITDPVPLVCLKDCLNATEKTTTANGRLSCVNNIVMANCDSGSKQEGPNSTCSEMRKDAETPRCTVKLCPEPEDPKFGHVLCRDRLHVTNGLCEVKCDHGTVHSIRCQEDLTWTEPPACTPPSCSPLTNSSGGIFCSPSGKQCVKRCSKDQLSQMMTCQETGEWDNKPTTLSCVPSCKVEVNRGFLDCHNEDAQNLFDEFGVPHSTQCSLKCNAGFSLTGSSDLTCNRQGLWTSGKCEETILVIAGGETDGEIVDTVEVHANAKMYSDHYSSCLPSLPMKVQWGNIGLVEDELLVCGGMTEEQGTGSPECWRISTNTGVWRQHIKLTR
jgi:hypothetical protein